jgi:hypothetical protein
VKRRLSLAAAACGTRTIFQTGGQQQTTVRPEEMKLAQRVIATFEGPLDGERASTELKLGLLASAGAGRSPRATLNARSER